MGTSLLVSIVVLAASVFLLVGEPKNALRIVLVIAAGIAVLLELGIVHLSMRGLPTREVLAGVFAVLGAVLYFRSSAKAQVTAATCVTLVGTIGLLASLHVLR